MNVEMTNEEAIANLNHVYGFMSPIIKRSFDVAFKALEEEQMSVDKEADYDDIYIKLEHLRQTIISMDLSYSQTGELLAQILQIENQLTDTELKSDKQQKGGAK